VLGNYTIKTQFSINEVCLKGEKIGLVNFTINDNVMNLNLIMVYDKYKSQGHAISILKELFDKFDMVQIEGLGIADDGEFFWKKINAKMSDDYTYSGSGKYKLGRQFVLTKTDFLEYCCERELRYEKIAN